MYARAHLEFIMTIVDAEYWFSERTGYEAIKVAWCDVIEERCSQRPLTEFMFFASVK